MVVVTTRPLRKPNTTSNAFGVERKDSLTLVTSWIASAAHQTGQRPPTGHTAVDLADTGTGTCSQRWVTGAHGETASPKNCGSLTGSPSIAHARSTVVECSEGTSTGPAHGPWIRSLSQSASRFTTPFFPPLPERPIARATRPIPLLVAPIAPGIVSVGTRGWPAQFGPLGHVLRVPTGLRQVLRDRSTASSCFRHLLHSSRSSRYFSRSLLRLFNKDRTRIRLLDFALSALSKIRFYPTPLSSMPKLPTSFNPILARFTHELRTVRCG